MEQNQKIFGLTNDFLFKAVFGQESNKKLTICLLNALLQLDEHHKIKEIEILNPFNAQNYKDEKLSVLDTRVKDVAGKYYNIEMQVRDEEDFIKRFSYYLAKLYSCQLTKNEPYSDLKPAIGIAIIGYDLFPQSNNIDEKFVFKNDLNNISFNDVMTMHFIGLTKLSKNKPLKDMTRFEKWVYLLYNSKKYGLKDSELPSEMESEDGMKEVVDCVKKSNSDKEMRALMEDRENSQISLSLMRGSAYRKGRQDGYDEGIEKGKIKALVSLVYNGIITKQQAAESLNMTVESFETAINENIN